MIHPLATLALINLVGAGARAQDRPVSSEPSFEVASVKANLDDTVPEAISLQPNGNVRFTGFRVPTLIAMAYRSEGIQRFDQLVGGPPWTASERFDIVAKAREERKPQEATPNAPAMLPTLLRDRFGLRVHAETPQHAGLRARRGEAQPRVGPELRESPRHARRPGPRKRTPMRIAGAESVQRVA